MTIKQLQKGFIEKFFIAACFILFTSMIAGAASIASNFRSHEKSVNFLEDETEEEPERTLRTSIYQIMKIKRMEWKVRPRDASFLEFELVVVDVFTEEIKNLLLYAESDVFSEEVSLKENAIYDFELDMFRIKSLKEHRND